MCLTNVVFLSDIDANPNVFNGCNQLDSVFYFGSSTVDANIFGSSNPSNICVSTLYEGDLFGGKSVTSNTEECKNFRESFDRSCNHCFKPLFINGRIVPEKRENATLWEKQTSGCYIYQCINATGPEIQGNCKSEENQICMDNKCFDAGKDRDKKWIVEIQFEESVLHMLNNTSQVAISLSKLTNINISNFVVGSELEKDEDIYALVFVNDKDTAFLMMQSVDGCTSYSSDSSSDIITNTECEGILKHVKFVSVLEPTVTPSSSSINPKESSGNNNYPLLIILVMTLLALFLA